CSQSEACAFEDCFVDADSRPALIVTFLALLEMIRLKLIRVFQSGSFGPLRVYKLARPADAAQLIRDPRKVYKDHHASDERRAKSDELAQTAASDERES